MYRTRMMLPASQHQRWQVTWPRLLAPLAIWICVSASLRYGYYGDSRVVLGPSSSRLMKASSVFVKQIEIALDSNIEVLLHSFNEKPQLSSQTNWSRSGFVVVEPYSRQGFSLWLNKGSSIRLRWETQTHYLNQLEGVVIKGYLRESRFVKLQPKQTMSTDANAIRDPIGKEAEYIIEEDDEYQVGVVNMNSRNIVADIQVNVSAKIYDITKASKMCSTAEGSCRLSLLFPNTHYVVLTLPENGDPGGWMVEVSFLVRVLVYLVLFVFVAVVIFLILKYLEARDEDDESTGLAEDTYRTSHAVAAPREVTENEPMMQAKPNTYGTNEQDDDKDSDASSSSSEDLYDEKLCVICYDEQRNCFFVPCGHCATCYDCAQRTMNGESKVCPICRRLIRRVRRLFHS